MQITQSNKFTNSSTSSPTSKSRLIQAQIIRLEIAVEQPINHLSRSYHKDGSQSRQVSISPSGMGSAAVSPQCNGGTILSQTDPLQRTDKSQVITIKFDIRPPAAIADQKQGMRTLPNTSQREEREERLDSWLTESRREGPWNALAGAR